MQHLKAIYLVNKAETDIIYTRNVLILVIDLIVRLLLLMLLLAFAFENHSYGLQILNSSMVVRFTAKF